MNPWFISIPFISALAGGLLGWATLKILFTKSILEKSQKLFANRLGKIASDTFSFDEIENKISDTGNFKKIMPMIEEHVDEFLRVRLSKEMPWISMFISNKTINSLKNIFMQELEILFPQVMKNYAATLKNDFDIEKIITQKIAAIPSTTLKEYLEPVILKPFLVYGIITGFITGLLQILLISLL